MRYFHVHGIDFFRAPYSALPQVCLYPSLLFPLNALSAAVQLALMHKVGLVQAIYGPGDVLLSLGAIAWESSRLILDIDWKVVRAACAAHGSATATVTHTSGTFGH